jgi:hypothetical protein
MKSAQASSSASAGTAERLLPKEIGGVVDTSLKVYGTSNVRVVDASIMPFQVTICVQHVHLEALYHITTAP